MPVNWSAAAEHLVARVERAAVVLDERGVVRLANQRFLDLMHWKRAEVVGHELAALCCTDSQQLFTKRLRGMSMRVRCTIEGRDRAPSLDCEIELSGAGGGVGSGVLAIVERHRPVTAPRDAALFDEEYVVATHSADAGRLLVRHSGDGQVHRPAAGTCFKVIASRETPCPGCPVLNGTNGGAEVRTFFRAPRAAGGTQLVVARPAGPSMARVGVLRVDGLYPALLDARVADLRRAHRLTAREAEVLRLIVDGLAPADMAQALGITASTIKFHQSSLLAKLGADSRADLFRVLFPREATRAS